MAKRATEGSGEAAQVEQPRRDPLTDAQDQFILEWGRMSSSWGINRTMAQIHALLFVVGIPLEVNEIMDRLQISRGNASMNLRELMDWGIVRRFRRPGDRKDTYYSETDPYQMFARVVRERKRREIDPTADAIREVLTKLGTDDHDPGVRILRTRLEGLLEIFDIIDAAYKQVFRGTDPALDLQGLLGAARRANLIDDEVGALKPELNGRS
jgi:DNA-binding transcriptional regulator GbsR (MarR family)